MKPMHQESSPDPPISPPDPAVYVRPAGSQAGARPVAAPPGARPAAPPDEGASAPPPQPVAIPAAPPAAWVPGATAAQAPRSERPAVPPGADLAPATPARRWVALCFAASFLVYVALIPQFLRFSNPPTGDQPLYLMDTISLVQDGDLNIANNYAQHDEDKFYKLAPHPEPFAGQVAPYPLPPQLAVTPNRPPREQYSWHPPGLGVALVPAWIAGGWFGLWWPATMVFMCVVGALVGVNIFLLAYQLTGRLGIAWAVWLPLAFSNPILTYSLLIFTELPTGLLLLYAFRRLAVGWAANRPWQLVLAGTAIGSIPWMAWRCLPISAGLGAYAAVQWWRAGRSGSPARAGAGWARRAGRRVGQALWLAGPALALLALIVPYDLFLFGTIGPNPVPGQGAEPPVFYWPWGDANARVQFVNGLFALFFDEQWGLLPHAPLYVLAGFGLIVLWRRGGHPARRLLGWMAVVTIPYLVEIAAFNYWGGLWCPPARYLATLVPLLGGPLAMTLLALGANWLYRILYALLALPGFGYVALALTDPRVMFPSDRGHFWTWLATSPDLPLHLDLRGILPTFAWPDTIRQPWTTGWIIGAAALITAGCALWSAVLSRRGAGAPGRAWPLAARGAVWLGALGLIGGGWLTINGDYLKHKTVLVQEHRWPLNPPPVQPLGLAYLDGSVFITDYRQGTLGALDSVTGAYRLITPHTAQASLSFSHPGDVKVGPDGLLYVLNNGSGGQALFVMQPDGTVVRQVALPGESDLTTGLSVAADGHFYVSDMRQGQIFVYPPGGGAAQAQYGGAAGGFNNITTVAVAPDGTIYAAELGTHRIHELNAQGAFVRAYDLGCSSWGAVVAGSWLDVTCDQGFLSINRTTQAIQGGMVAPPDAQLIAPTGLTYGPDGTLYIVDQTTLGAYRVER